MAQIYDGMERGESEQRKEKEEKENTRGILDILKSLIGPLVSVSLFPISLTLALTFTTVVSITAVAMAASDPEIIDDPRGFQGAQGIEGPQGIPGEQGERGPRGLSEGRRAGVSGADGTGIAGYHTERAFSAIDFGTVTKPVTAEAVCSRGTLLSGGGGNVESFGGTSYGLVGAYPNADGTGWIAAGHGQEARVTTYAMCAIIR